MTDKTIVDMPEAPASVNMKIVSGKGYDFMFTLRDFDELVLLDRLGTFIKKLESMGMKPANGNGYKAPVQSHLPPQPQAPPPQTVDDFPTEQPGQDQKEYDDFTAESLTGTMNNGKVYWKVKGGRWAKFGVTVWQEVLEAAGFNFDELDPAQTYDLTGYTATAMLEDGKPKKVIKLVK